MKGHFITFEGVEGSGKTTQLALLEQHLLAKGYPVVKTREPGGTKIGDAIRSLILDSKNQIMDSRTEFFLYLASRAQHLKEIILPALDEGKIVICDRFSDATIAYQGYGRNLPIDQVEEIVHFASQGCEPDLTFLFDMDVQKGLARLVSPPNETHSLTSIPLVYKDNNYQSYQITFQTRQELNRLDKEKLQFHETIRQAYLTLARAHPKRIQVINADSSKEEIAMKIKEAVDAVLS